MSLRNTSVPDPRSQDDHDHIIVAEVTVTTASVIVASVDDPYRVLIADSAKHPRPVIPGGKVEVGDDQSDRSIPGLSCILRETLEEIGTPLLNPRYIGKAEDPDRNIRLVTASTLASVVVFPALPAGIAADSIVKAHYGCPGHLFVGHVDESALTDTEELKRARFVDIRTLGPGDLSAGHDVVVLTYRRMLDEGLNMLPEGALTNFDLEREQLSAMRRL